MLQQQSDSHLSFQKLQMSAVGSFSESDFSSDSEASAALRNSKKPRGPKADKRPDPLVDVVLQPTETMADEMNAMKQVFLRMSEKKVKQKQERKEECKRLYEEAFQTDVEQLFRRTQKTRTKAMETLTGKIDSLTKELESSNEKIRKAHDAYSSKFTAEFDRVRTEIEQLKELLKDVEHKYVTTKSAIEENFDSINSSLEVSLRKLQNRMRDGVADKSFIKVFKPQIERLLT